MTRRGRVRVSVASPPAVLTGAAGRPLCVWRAVHDPTGGRTWALPALAVGTAGAGLVGGLRARAGTRNLTARYLRFASIGGLVFPVQFLWLSPVGRTLLTPAAAVDADAMAAVAQALGSDPPPVVVVLLDELPTASLTGGVPRHRRHRGPHPGAARRDVLTPPASGRARSYLRNLLVVLSASTLPPVWQVGQ